MCEVVALPSRVLMLLSNEYRPDVRVEKEAKALIGSGRSVTILSWDRNHKRQPDEMVEGVTVHRIRTRQFSDKKGLVFNFASFLFASLRRANEGNYDVVHAHDLDTLLLGVLISRLKGIPLIYDAHEHYADMVSQDLPQPVARCFDLIERALVTQATQVIVANPGHYDYLKEWSNGDPVVDHELHRSPASPGGQVR